MKNKIAWLTVVSLMLSQCVPAYSGVLSPKKKIDQMVQEAEASRRSGGSPVETAVNHANEIQELIQSNAITQEISQSEPVYEYDSSGRLMAYTVTSPDSQRSVRVAFSYKYNWQLTGYKVQVKDAAGKILKTYSFDAQRIFVYLDGATFEERNAKVKDLTRIQFTPDSSRLVAMVTNGFLTTQSGYSSEREVDTYVINSNLGGILASILDGRTWGNRTVMNNSGTRLFMLDWKFAVTASGNGSGQSRSMMLNLANGNIVKQQNTSGFIGTELKAAGSDGFLLETRSFGNTKELIFQDFIDSNSVLRIAKSLVEDGQIKMYTRKYWTDGSFGFRHEDFSDTLTIEDFVSADKTKVYRFEFDRTTGILNKRLMYDATGKVIKTETFPPLAIEITRNADGQLVMTTYDPKNGRIVQKDTYSKENVLARRVLFDYKTGKQFDNFTMPTPDAQFADSAEANGFIVSQNPNGIEVKRADGTQVLIIDPQTQVEFPIQADYTKEKNPGPWLNFLKLGIEKAQIVADALPEGAKKNFVKDVIAKLKAIEAFSFEISTAIPAGSSNAQVKVASYGTGLVSVQAASPILDPNNALKYVLNPATDTISVESLGPSLYGETVSKLLNPAGYRQRVQEALSAVNRALGYATGSDKDNLQKIADTLNSELN